MDSAVPEDLREKSKECKKRYKYLDLAKELKKLWNMKVTIISIVIGVLGAIAKRFVQKLGELVIRGRVETTQTTALLRSSSILRRVLETCCHSNLSEKLSANTSVKNS